eukprot:scaffold33081_cov19-Prasinocladus_malaysianus.AAC.2
MSPQDELESSVRKAVDRCAPKPAAKPTAPPAGRHSRALMDLRLCKPSGLPLSIVGSLIGI